MVMCSPYTYLIGWSELNVWYYGVRYSKKADPSDLWVSYFTSSRHVAVFRKEHGDPDVIQVRKVFSTQKKAQDHEFKVLRRMKVAKDARWLNKTDCASFPAYSGEDSPRYGKVSCRMVGEDNPMFGVRGELHHCFGKKLSDETKEKIRHRALGRPVSEEARQKMSEARKGKKHSEESREKRRKPKPKSQCPHCGLVGGGGVMNRFHFDRCKSRPPSS